MPTIPLPRNGQSIQAANAPAPVLDRQSRPRANFEPIARAAAGLASERAAEIPLAAATGGALAEVGRGVQIAAEAIKAERRAKMVTDVGQFELEAGQAFSGFEQYAQNNLRKPYSWEPEFERVAQDFMGEFLAREHLTPEAREEISLRARRWYGQKLAQVQQLARKQQFGLAGAATRAAAEAAMESGDREGFDRIVSGGVREGYFWDHEAQDMAQRFERFQRQRRNQERADAREADFNRFNALIAADPQRALKTANKTKADGTVSELPGLDAGDIQQAQAYARSAVNRHVADAYENLIDGVLVGAYDAAGIAAKADEAGLTKVQAQRLQQIRNKRIEAQQQELPLDLEAMGKLLRDIEAYDPKSDADAVQWIQLMDRVANDALGGNRSGEMFQGVFRQKLWNRHPYRDRADYDDTVPARLFQEFDDIFKSYEDSGAFGDTEEPEGVRAYATWHADLYRRLQQAVESDPERFRERGAVDAWVAEQLRGKAHGEAINSSIGSQPLRPGSHAQRAREILGL